MKTIVVSMALLLTSFSSFAQPDERREKIEAQFVAFVTQKLDLTSEEAQQFWPIFNEYEDKMKEIREQKHDLMEQGKKEDATDKDIEALLSKNFELRQQELDLEKEYNSKFLSVLPARKVGKLYMAREQFKRMLMERLRAGEARREEERGPPRRRP